MKSGSFPLQPMYEHAKKNNPPLKGDGRGAEKDPVWSAYSQVRNDIMIGVPAITGWYIWLRASVSTIEEIMYVGKTTKKRMANLQTRLYDHFKRERYSFWGKGKFSGCTHLVWVGFENLPNEQVENIERYLIRWFKPTKNKVRANPKGDLELAKTVRDQFELLFSGIFNV